MTVDIRAASRTVMIVDDAFFMRNLLRSILEMAGYRVVAEAEDGEKAVAAYREHRPDLVIMDVIMPVMNGVDAARQILDFDRDACVVMCSIIGLEQMVDAAREAGAAGVIFKPFTADEVITTLWQALGERPAPAGRDREKEAVPACPRPQ